MTLTEKVWDKKYLTKQYDFFRPYYKFYFGKGPWDKEPDLENFTHKGIECFIKRIIFPEHKKGDTIDYKDFKLFGGFWCGYVMIPESTEMDVDALEVHYGITFDTILNKVRILGFDCAHMFDVIPSIEYIKKNSKLQFSFPYHPDFVPEYRTYECVKEETKSLAEQVAEQLKNMVSIDG